MERSLSLALALALALGACSHSAPAETHDTTLHDETPPAAQLPGNAAVRARLAALPAPPSPWTTPVAALTPADFVALCPYLDQNVHLEGSTVTCPDGSTAQVTEHHCEPESWAQAARSLPCAITLGEITACRLAMVEHPCDSGAYGENLDECEAFEACTCDGSRAPEVTQ